MMEDFYWSIHQAMDQARAQDCASGLAVAPAVKRQALSMHHSHAHTTSSTDGASGRAVALAVERQALRETTTSTMPPACNTGASAAPSPDVPVGAPQLMWLRAAEAAAASSDVLQEPMTWD
jgi:hypothetical protein